MKSKLSMNFIFTKLSLEVAISFLFEFNFLWKIPIKMGKYLKSKTKNSEISGIKSGVVGATTDRFQRIENKVEDFFDKIYYIYKVAFF